jgi:archaemetzincin
VAGQPKQPVQIVCLGAVPEESIDSTARVLEQKLPTCVTGRRHAELPPGALDRGRRPYNASTVLDLVRSTVQERGDVMVLGLCTEDLRTLVLSYVFGCASTRDRTAVVSLARLHQQFYGLVGDTGLFRERLAKEVLHEMGHLFGLRHCPQQDCVMSRAAGIVEIDLKGDDFCATCREKILSSSGSGRDLGPWGRGLPGDSTEEGSK